MYSTKIRGNALSFVDLNSEKEDVVLMVHGHPFNHSMWNYQYDILSNFRIINPDLFGYGSSESNFDRIFIEQQALDLCLLLDQLGIEKVHLIGLSMGGQVIVEFARLFPLRTKSLVICASTPDAENDSSYEARMHKAKEIAEIGMTEHTKRTIHQYINTDRHPEGSEVYSHLYEMMSRTPNQGAIASHLGRAERRDNLNFLKQINVPTLVYAGELDHFFKVQAVCNVANNIKNARTVVIKGSGHLPNMEDPMTFNNHLSGFYNEIQRSE